MLAAALLLLPPTGPTPHIASPAGPAFGTSIRAGGEDLMPTVSVDLPPEKRPEPGIYRPIRVDWRHAPPDTGFYPAAPFAAKQQGSVFVSLTVRADGKPTACRVTKPSGIAAFDEHSCGDALANTVFHPGLDEKGRRFGGTVEGWVSYSLHQTAPPAPDEEADWPLVSERPQPLQAITLETLGIPTTFKANSRYDMIRALLAIDGEGRVTACLLTSPTYDDAIDKGACDRLRGQRFRPALGYDRRPTDYLYRVELPLQR